MIAAGGEGFPRSVAALRKVPGIGDYTAGAIASIAFKEVFHIFFFRLSYSNHRKKQI